MSIRKMILCLALAGLTSLVFGSDHKITNTTVSIQSKSKADYMNKMKYLQKEGFDVLGVNVSAGIIDLNVSKSELNKLSEKGINVFVEKNSNKKKKIDERYLNPSEIKSFLTNMNAKYPELTKLEVIGQTLEGRDILAIKISDNAKIKEVSEPAVLFNGMHHSREIMTPEVTTDIISYLLENYTTNSEVKSWVDNNEIWVLPMFNIDGNHKVWAGSNMWRKNTRGGYGVDINRNYPSHWGACNGSSGWKGSQTYRGSEAGSEPETKVMMNFVSTIKPVFNISYHAYSELVIYPMGCNGQRTVNKDVVEGIGKEMGRRLRYEPGTAWEILYSVDGSDIDWMYEQEQVIPYVIEVSSRSDGFQPSYDKRDATVERNRKGWQFLLERMEGPGVHGVTHDFTKVKVLKNTKGVFVLSQTYKINPDGSFHIILTPGQYNLEFGGEHQIHKIMTVNVEDKKIVLNP